MVEQIFANFFSLAALLAVLGFFIRKWMDKLEKQLETVCEDLKTKVSKTDCHERMEHEDEGNVEIWDWLKYHEHTQEGRVVVPPRKR